MLLSVSENAPPVSGTPSVLDSVKVIVLVEPYAMLAGANALAIVAEAAVTVSTATLETAPVGAWVLETPPDVWPEQRLATEVAYRRARRYLSHEKDLFQ